MAKVGILIEKWMIKVFKKHLDKQGFTFEKHKGPGKHITTLIVNTDSPLVLHKMIVDANNECVRSKMH